MFKIDEELKDKISYALIAAILLTAVVPLAITAEGSALVLFRALFVGVLAGLYLLTAETKDLFFFAFASFVLLSAVQLVSPTLDVGATYIKAVFALPFLLSAIAFGLLAYEHSKEFKTFEMLEFLLVVFLLISATKYSIVTEYSMYYAFGTCFIIATLIYNNNLWMRYKDSEKELLILLLVVSFVDVIQVSSKFISF
jgi:hypothetical protein